MTDPSHIKFRRIQFAAEVGKGDSQPIFPNCARNELSACVMQSDGSKSLD